MHKKKNIRRIAVALMTGELATRRKGTKIGYNQNFVIEDQSTDRGGHACNTNACIAGHASYLLGGPKKNGTAMWDFAVGAFGLNAEEAMGLFGGRPANYIPTAADAALVLFNLAETGKIDWSIARPKVEA